MTRPLVEEALTGSVISAFFEVYNYMGYGFLEHLYANAMERELIARGHAVGREVKVYVEYKGEYIGTQRLDMIVDEKLIVENKSTFQLAPHARRQLYSYLRATNIEVGLLLHFGPEAKFYREVAQPRRRIIHPNSFNPANQANPADPNSLVESEAID